MMILLVFYRWERAEVVMIMMVDKKMRPKWRFIFQIYDHDIGTQLHEEMGQKKNVTALNTTFLLRWWW
jgi:hypothetical protein